MEQFGFLGIFCDSDMMRKFAFKAMNLRDNYALLAIISPILAAIFHLTREKSAHFQKRDCFGCLPPHKIAV